MSQPPYQQNTDLRIRIAAIVIFVFCFILLATTSVSEWWQEPVETPGTTAGTIAWRAALQNLLRDVAVTGIVGVSLGAVWEMSAKRAFRDEIFQIVKMSDSVNRAGISDFAADFAKAKIDWDTLFQNTYHLDLVFGYARTWRNTHEGKLKALVTKPNVHLRVFLPNPEDSLILDELARRFKTTSDDLASRIREAESFYLDLSKTKHNNAVIEVYRCNFCMVYACYRFDDKTILTLYNHRKERGPVLTFTVDNGGAIYAYLVEEINSVLASALAVKVSIGEPNP